MACSWWATAPQIFSYAWSLRPAVSSRRKLVFEVEEFENEGVLDRLIGEHGVFRTLLLSASQHGSPVLGEGHPLVELGTDLPVELADRE